MSFLIASALSLLAAGGTSSDSLKQQPHVYYALVVARPKAYAFRTRRRKLNIERVAKREHTDRIQTVATMVKKKVNTIVAVKTPPKKISEAVAMTFQDVANAPINGASVKVEIYDSSNSLLSSTVYKTGEGKPGVVWVKPPKLPAVVKAEIVDGEPWEVKDPTASVFTLTGKEGDVTHSSSTSIERQLGASITLGRPYTEISLKTDPKTTVFWGQEKVAEADDNGVADIKLPKVAENSDLNFYLQKQSGPLAFDSEISLDKVTPDVPNEVNTKPLTLASISDIQIAKYPDDSGQVASSSDINGAYGRAKKKDKSFNGEETEGTEWWEYPRDGVDFKLRKVRNDKGKPEELVERIRLTSAAAGQVGPIQVGTPNDQLDQLMGKGSHDDAGPDPGTTEYLDGGIIVHKGANAVDWIEICRPVALLKTGIMMGPVTGRSRIFLQVDKGDATFTSLVHSKFEHLPGLEVVGSAPEADLVVHVSFDGLETSHKNMLGTVPMLYSAECKLSYSIMDQSTGAPALDVEGNPVPTPAVDVTARADYEKDVIGGAMLLGLAGVAGMTIKRPAERIAVMALLGGTIDTAVKRMKDTMTRAVGRTNNLAVSEAVDPVLRSLESATLFRARVQSVSQETRSVTLNVGSSNGVTQGMEFGLYNENIPAFSNSIDGEGENGGPRIIHSLKEDYVVARATEVTATQCVCKLFRIKHSVSNKAFEEGSETEYDEGISGLLDPRSGLVNARIVLRVAPKVPEQTQ